MSSPEASNAPRSPIMSSRHLAWALDEKNFNTIPIHPGPDGCLIQSSRREYGGDPHKTISEATPDITPPDSDHRPLILPLTPAETHSPIDEPDHRGRSPVIDVKSEKPRRRSTIPTIRTNLGLDAEAPIMESHRIDNGRTWSIVRTIFREPLAEFFGTFVMVLFGDGSVAQVLLGSGQKNAPDGFGYGEYQSINWGYAFHHLPLPLQVTQASPTKFLNRWGLGAMLGIYVAGDSGGYLNPAVTLCFCIFRKLPWRRLPIYVLAQMLGGLCAAAVIYGNYITGIDEHEGHGVRTVPPAPRATAGIFATYPQGFLTKPSQFFSDFIASTILMFVIFALKDGSNPGEAGRSGARQMFPIALLFLIFGLGACFGYGFFSLHPPESISRLISSRFADVLNIDGKLDTRSTWRGISDRESCVASSATGVRYGLQASITSGCRWWRRSAGRSLGACCMTCRSTLGRKARSICRGVALGFCCVGGTGGRGRRGGVLRLRIGLRNRGAFCGHEEKKWVDGGCLCTNLLSSLCRL